MFWLGLGTNCDVITEQKLHIIRVTLSRQLNALTAWSHRSRVFKHLQAQCEGSQTTQPLNGPKLGSHGSTYKVHTRQHAMFTRNGRSRHVIRTSWSQQHARALRANISTILPSFAFPGATHANKLIAKCVWFRNTIDHLKKPALGTGS